MIQTILRNAMSPEKLISKGCLVSHGRLQERLVRQLLKIAVIAIVAIIIRIIDGINRQIGIVKMDGIPSLARGVKQSV